jgi:23S rRNA pseudouridine1911/1915/1917 synthase
VLGDPLYTDEAARALAAELGVDGFRLHAWTLRFVHPGTGEAISIEAPPPGWALVG